MLAGIFTVSNVHGRVVCSDGFKSLEMPNDLSLETKVIGFDLFGIASGTEFDCLPQERSFGGWFYSSRLTCASRTFPRAGMTVQVTEVGGIPWLQILGPFNVPYFTATCLKR